MNSLMYDSYTIFWRELKRYKKSRSGVLIRLIQPAIWIIVIGNTFSGTQPLIQSVGFEGEYIDESKNVIIIAKPGVYEDQPAGGGGEENTIGGLTAKNAIQWAEAGKGTLDKETGATTWQVSGKIYPSIINKKETSAYSRISILRPTLRPKKIWSY